MTPQMRFKSLLLSRRLRKPLLKVMTIVVKLKLKKISGQRKHLQQDPRVPTMIVVRLMSNVLAKNVSLISNTLSFKSNLLLLTLTEYFSDVKFSDLPLSEQT